MCIPPRDPELPTLHHPDPRTVSLFRHALYRQLALRNSETHDLPKIVPLSYGRFAVWDCRRHDCRASAWNENRVVRWGTKPPWIDPPPGTVVNRTVHGDHVGYTSWFEGNFGHYLDDHLPTIAYLKAQLPEETRFLLVDTPLSRNVMRFLDPSFYERITWIQQNEIVRVVRGRLLVTKSKEIPVYYGCCRHYDFLRHWIHNRLPSVPTRRTVVYYSRQSSDTIHGRVLDKQLETRVLRVIGESMRQHNLGNDELVVFTGQDKEGHTLSVAEQFAIFRAAHTLVGPHGAGFVGNMAWVDPLPMQCEKRVKVLEFIPGVDSTVVQPMFHSHYMRWRVWPVEFHNILYTGNSTKQKTFIDLDDLRSALNDMWSSPVQEME